jgi:hypothetical protein
MSDAKRIVGPWQADFDDLNGRCRAIYEERGVFPVCCFDPLLNHEYSAASGRLIAAAPELLLACQLLLDLMDNWHPIEGMPKYSEQAGMIRRPSLRPPRAPDGRAQIPP